MQGQPIVVLLVEDNIDHAELVTRNLNNYQVANQIMHVKDGEAALDYLFRRGHYAVPGTAPAPDVVLLDLRLPKISGLEVLKQIRQSTEHRSLPVVVLTTSNADEDIFQAYDNQVNSYLVKPVDFDKFTSLMKDLGFYWLGWNSYPNTTGKTQAD